MALKFLNNGYFAGKVGIGIVTPTTDLHIKSGSNANLLIEGNQSTRFASLQLKNASQIWIPRLEGTSQNFVIRDDTASSEPFRIKPATSTGSNDSAIVIDGNANVGIGTTSPSAKLDVIGVGRILMPNDPLTGAVTAKILSYSTAPYGMVFRSYSSGTNSIQVQRENNNSQTFALSLQPNDGNVGIGTTTPLVKLHVETTNSSTARFAYNGSNYQDLNWEGSNIVGGSHVFKIGGAEKMRIDSSGNVGILTTSMLNTGTSRGSLTIGGSVAGTLNIGNGSINFGIYATTAESSIYSLGVMKFSVGSGLPERMRIDSNGNVGIGTTSPSAKLNVVGTGTQLGTSGYYYNTLLKDATNSGVLLGGNNTDNGAGFLAGINELAFLTFGTSWGERMRITGAGNVGIGTASPALQSGGTGLHINATTSSELKFTNNTTGATASDGTALVSNSNNFAINNREAGFLTFGTSNLTRMVVDSAGKVGIGVTAPTQSLHISGNMRLTGAFRDGLNSQGAANYVLTSTGSNSTRWVAGSAIPGVPGGSGTLNTIPLWTPDGDTLGNSVITQPSTNIVRMSGNGAYFNILDTSAAARNIDIGHWVSGQTNIESVGGTLSIGTQSNHNIVFETNGSNKATILAGGNVGINVTNPGARLEIKGTGAVAGLTFKTTDSSSNETFFVQDGGRTGVRYYPFTIGQTSGTSAASGARFQVATTAGDFVVLNDGKTGIGTTSPSNKLDVQITTSNRTTLEPVLSVSASGNGPYTGFGPKISFDSNIYYGAGTGNPAGIIETAYIGAVMGTTYATNSDLVFATRDGATSVTEKMRILGNGNVGIGHAVLYQKFTVNGNIDIRGGNGSYLTFNNGDANIVINNNGAGRDLSFKTYSGSSSAERMRIDKDGNVGIGTTSPVSSLNITTTKTIALDTAAKFLTLGLTVDDLTAGNTAGGGGGIAFRSKNTNAGTQIVFGAIDAIKESANVSDFKGSLRFFTNQNSTGVPLERMRIDSNGTVLINASASRQAYSTTAPTKLCVQGGMSEFETTLNNKYDFQNSPISILERANIHSGSTDNKYSPNLNFHWSGLISNSLWMSANGHLNYGSYTSAGVPAADGTIRAGNLNTGRLAVNGTANAIELNQSATGSATYYVMDNTVETGGKRYRFGYSGGSLDKGSFSIYNQTDNIMPLLLSGANATFAGNVTATGNYTAGNSKIIYKAQRSGGAVAGDWSYDDGTTDMSLGTSTSHSFSLKTGNTRALTINSSQNATFAATSSALTVIARDNLFVDAGQLYIGADDSSTDNTFRQVVNTGAGSFTLQKRISGTFTDVLSFNNSNNATIAGGLVLGTPSNGNLVNKLTIASGTVGDGIFLTGIGTTAGMGTGNYKAIDFQYSNTDASFQSAIRFVVADSTAHGGQIEFFTDNSSGTNTKALTLNKSQNATFAGNVNLGTAKILNFSGTSFQILHDGSNGLINNSTGDIKIQNSATDKDIIFKVKDGASNVEVMRIDGSSSNVGIGNTSPNYKLSVSGGIEAGGKITYTKSAGSLNTTGYAVAGITALPNGNGFSCGFTFTCFGGAGKYQKLVYSCYNSVGTWNAKKVIDEGTNDLDVAASANGSTITFTFKARSSSQSFTPRVTVEAAGIGINSTYA